MPKEGDLYVNEHGGRQSYVSARIDLIPPEHLILLGQCLGFGAKKYGEDNWHQIPQNENLNHALVHILKWLSGDRTEPHLVNTLARVHFALWHAIQDGQQPLEYIHPDMLKEQQNAEVKAILDEIFPPKDEVERRNCIYQGPRIEPGQTDRT